MMSDTVLKSATTGRLLGSAVMIAVSIYLGKKGIDLTEEHKEMGIQLIMAAIASAGAAYPVARSKWRSVKRKKKGE
jgi:uncharacterized membrane protein YdjX (TVP38/TMEM64 family)